MPRRWPRAGALRQRAGASLEDLAALAFRPGDDAVTLTLGRDAVGGCVPAFAGAGTVAPFGRFALAGALRRCALRRCALRRCALILESLADPHRNPERTSPDAEIQTRNGAVPGRKQVAQSSARGRIPTA